MKSTIVKYIFLLIIFSNQIFAKDFDNLFNINMEIQDDSIDESIDKSFNDLIFRLMGYQDLEKLKMIKGNYSSKDFLKRYGVVSLDQRKYLQASFDEDIVMKQFIENDISFIGRNRPVIFLDIQIDNGFNKPFKIESVPYKTGLESSIQRIFVDISEKRGLFYEFPLDTIKLDKKDYFFDNEEYNEFDQYKFDYFDSMLITRSGINYWSMSYKDEISFFDNADDMIERIKLLFNDLSTDYLRNFILDNSARTIKMKVDKVYTEEQFENLLFILDKMISIKEYSIRSFKHNEISFSLTIFGTEDQFIKSVKTHKDLLYENSSKNFIEASLNSI